MSRVVLISVVTLLCHLFAAPTDAQAGADLGSGDRWLAEQMVTTQDLPGFYPTANHEMPASEVIPGSGLYYDTVRSGSLITSHVRGFASFDGMSELRTALVEATNASFAAVNNGAAETGFDAPQVELSLGSDDEYRSIVTTNFARGRIRAKIVLLSNHEPDPAKDLVKAAANRQYSRLTDSVNLSDRTTVSMKQLQARLYLGMLWALVNLQLGIWLVASLSDRGSRDRLLRFVLRRKAPPWQSPARYDDVSASAQKRVRAHRTGVLIRAAVFLALFTVTFEIGFVKQLLLFAVFGFVLSVIQLFTARRAGRAGFMSVHGIRASIVVVITGTTGISLAAAGLQLILLMAVKPLGIAPESSEEIADKFVQIMLVLGLLLLALADIPHRLARRYAARNVRRKLARDGRQEVLLLRSFMDDNLTLRTRRTGRQTLLERLALRRRERIEEFVCWNLWQHGPVVALGEPGTTLPPLGAARTFYQEPDWRQSVVDKVRSCRFIVFLVGRTPALMWEISAVRQTGALHRAIFVLPPTSAKEGRRRLTVLASALGLDERVFPPLDQRHKYTLALRFDSDGKPCVYVSHARDDLSYQVAIESAAEAVVGASPATVHNPSTAAAAARPVTSLLRTSPTRREARAARWGRRWRTWPWLASITISFLGSVLTVGVPSTPPPPQIPGTPLSQNKLSDFAELGRERFVGLDRQNRQLVHIEAGKTTPVRTLPETPQLVAAANDIVLVTTFAPYTLIAFHREQQLYTEMWRTSLPSNAFGLQIVEDRVAIVLPQSNQVLTVDLGTGANHKLTTLPDRPFSLAVHRGNLLVGSIGTASVSWVDPRTGDLTKTTSSAVSPLRLEVLGDVLYVGSIENSAITEESLVDGRVLGRADVERFNGVMAVGPRQVLVGTYHEIPQLVSLDSSNLRREASVEVPDELAEAMFIESSCYVSLGIPGYLVRLRAK